MWHHDIFAIYSFKLLSLLLLTVQKVYDFIILDAFKWCQLHIIFYKLKQFYEKIV